MDAVLGFFDGAQSALADFMSYGSSEADKALNTDDLLAFIVSIANIAWVILIAAALIFGIITGIKLVFAQPDEKAAWKKKLLHAGVFFAVAFSPYIIWRGAISLMAQLEEQFYTPVSASYTEEYHTAIRKEVPESASPSGYLSYWKAYANANVKNKIGAEGQTINEILQEIADQEWNDLSVSERNQVPRQYYLNYLQSTDPEGYDTLFKEAINRWKYSS